MGFAQALSGLNGASKALEAIGNNIANGGTVGFKSSAAQFADVYATSLTGGGSSQVGIGVAVSKVAQQFSQGNITTSGNPLDIAINGGGMFRLDTNGSISYTRTGQFLLDRAGFIVNNGGKNLTGYSADPVTGVIVPGNYVPLQMNNAPIPPVATTLSEIQTNLDARALPPAAMTHGATAGGVAPSPLPLTITTGVDDSFDITVDGLGPFTVVLPAATYQTIGDLSTALELAINAKLSATTSAVDVSANTAGQLIVSSRSVGSFGSQGNGSTVTLTPTFDPADGTTVLSTGYEILFAGLPGRDANLVDTPSEWDPTLTPPALGRNPASATAGVDNFSSTDTTSFTASTAQTIYDSLGNPHTLSLYFVKTGQPGSWQMYSTVDNIAAPAPGTITGSSLLGAVPSTLDVSAANTNSAFDISVDGAATIAVTIPDDPGGGAYANAAALVSAINRAFTDLSGSAVDSTGTPVVVKATARLDPFGKLIIESNTVNVGSSVVITPPATDLNASTITALFGALPSSVLGGPAKVDTLLFKPDGSLVTSRPVTESFNITTGATSPLIFAVNLTGSTQYGIGFGVNQLLQDGYTSGKISGLSISADGIVQGNYSNGKSRNLGQIVLATFTNPNGLQSMGGNQWVETAASGQPIPGTPGSGSLGSVQSGAVEESNVDLTAELVAMITQQRAYQASAQTIKTIDQVLQTLVNLR